MERKDDGMKVLRVFFLGFVYGIFMKYIIDEIFVRDQYRMITNENSLLRQRIQELEARTTQRVQSTPPAMRHEEPRAALTHQPAQQIEATPAPVQSANSKDDLKLIKGIGPQMEKKLNNAGVYTFDEMSRLTTADLQMILGISKHATQNADNLLTQAKKFAKGKR
jgi:predicted flap endonuclease-1-like 5' DNA nuclease